MGNVLELENVSKKLGGRQVVDCVSFAVQKGEIFGFLGPNGAGKTTTIKMIVGLLRIDSGKIRINGIDVARGYEKAMRYVGGIIENPELYDYLSGRQNLQIFGNMYAKFPKQRYAEVIEQVGLTDRIKDKTKKYSLGMRQRLGVAQALLHDPKLLILDEPTNGLDPAGIHELRNTLRDLADRQGLAVLVSSHLLSEMELMCDKVAIIDKGVVTGIRTLDDIHHGLDEAMRSYEFDVDRADHAAAIIEKYAPDPRIEQGRVYCELYKEAAANIVSELVSDNIKLYGMNQLMRSLEDEFLSVTGKSKE